MVRAGGAAPLLASTGLLNGIVWSGSQFVAVGGLYVAAIFTSPDGVAWTPQIPYTDYNPLHGIAWSGNQFVAVGENGIILTSPDGVGLDAPDLRHAVPPFWRHLVG